jgi:DNA-binding response OmpR family regulator
MLRAGGVEVDLHAPTVRIHRGADVMLVDLPVTEHRLLSFLLQTPGHARSREEICHGVWPGTRVDLRTVDQYVRRLRRSLQRAGAAAIVQTLNRYGYRVEPALLAHAPNSFPQAGPVTELSRAIPTVPASRTTSSIDRS